MAVAQYWLDIAGRYEQSSVGFRTDDSTRAFATVYVQARDVPAALVGAFGDLADPRLRADLRMSFDVEVPDPNGRSGASTSRYATWSGPPPGAVLQVMTALATFNERLAADDRAEISAYWGSPAGSRDFLNVRITLRPRELRDLPFSKIDAAVPGSTAPRTADELVGLLDAAGVPYRFEVEAGSGRPFRTVDRTSR